MKLTPGWVEINGIAWTGSGQIRRVDVSTDGGASGLRRGSRSRCCPRRTRDSALWNWAGGEAVIMSRAVDETGYVQPTRTD